MKMRVPSDANEDAEDDKRTWVEHPVTKWLAADATNARARALDRLLSACRGSTDVKVVACFAEYIHEDALLNMVTGKWGKHENGA